MSDKHENRSIFSFILWAFLISTTISIIVLAYVVSNNDNEVEEIRVRILEYKLPDGVVMKITLNSTDDGFYDLSKSTMTYNNEILNLSDLELLSDRYETIRNFTESKMDIEIKK